MDQGGSQLELVTYSRAPPQDTGFLSYSTDVTSLREEVLLTGMVWAEACVQRKLLTSEAGGWCCCG